VLYHVGSRDERPDRQGFAHMFEHMMFRGSAHVAPEQHMRMVNTVGGMSNAFTSFDQTVYINTVPSEHLETILWLEADRMSSFKVSDEIYKTERKVVAEEWRMRQNQPYGNLFETFLKNAFTTHSYRWTPIGNMDHLRAAQVSELQDFFNTYYVPNNAVLVVSGDVDVEKTRAMVSRYFGWIPKGADVVRDIPAEPVQGQTRTQNVPDNVPLPVVFLGYHAPTYGSDDVYALNLLSDILGSGRSSRLANLLVNNDKPLCSEVSSPYMQLQDGGVIGAYGMVLPGRDVNEVQKVLLGAIDDVAKNGVTQEELDRARASQRVGLIKSRETCEAIAGNIGNEALFANDPSRVNTEFAKISAVTPADVRRVAQKYFTAGGATIVHMLPDPLGVERRKAVAQAAKMFDVAPSTRPVVARDVVFPADYPTAPPTVVATNSADFAKGIEFDVAGVRVIVMTDHRLPTVSLNYAMRAGSDNDPAGKQGLADFTGEMLRRGVKGMTYQQLNEDLEARGISLGINSSDDNTRLNGSCTSDQLDTMITRAAELLREPTFPQVEFDKLKEQSLSQLQVALESPTTVGENDLTRLLYGQSIPGRIQTPADVHAITLDDVKKFHAQFFRPTGAVLILAGDVAPERGRDLAAKFLGVDPSAQVDTQPVPAVDYSLPSGPTTRQILVVDRPESKQATIRMGLRTYTIQNEEKFIGNVANVILTSGIDSRLGRYVRAEKGLAYSVYGVFKPGRNVGSFEAGTETAIESTPDTVQAMWDVFRRMRTEDVTEKELREAQSRVAGQMVMQMQTVGQQANYRLEGILNGYPIDYHDKLPSRVASVTIPQVRELMTKYVDDARMVVVVVAPADKVVEGLKKFGEVTVLPMPAKRDGATTQPVHDELMK